MAGGEEESIKAAAASRRERLRALKVAQELLNTPDDDAAVVKPQEATTDGDRNGEFTRGIEPRHQSDDEEEDDAGEDNVNMKFRNYLPHDKQLQESKVTPPVLPKFEDPILAAPPPEEKTEDPFLNIAPKKPNWDLRRDVQKRLDKLERRTQKAMRILMVDVRLDFRVVTLAHMYARSPPKHVDHPAPLLPIAAETCRTPLRASAFPGRAAAADHRRANARTPPPLDAHLLPDAAESGYFRGFVI